MRPNWWMPVLALLPAGILSAQATPPPTLHSAWLAEVFDLDVDRAVGGYARLANDARTPTAERWLAAARLVELQRLGCAVGTPRPSAEDIPPALRPQFAAAQPAVDMQPILDRSAGSAVDLVERLRRQGVRLPDPRPLVPEVHRWAADLLGPARDRWRRMQSPANRPRGNDAAPFSDHVWAAMILRAELDGQRVQAQAQRRLYFPEWKPEPRSDEPEVLLQRIRTNLDAWTKERGLTIQQLQLLRRLGETIEQQAEKDPESVLGLIDRLPLYANRLLRR